MRYSSLLRPNLTITPETESEIRQRYRGFGAALFPRLFARYPQLQGAFRFFRDTRTGDVWAVCETQEYQFGVQLDPDIEGICVWDHTWFDEIGSWLDDPVADAIAEIEQRFFKPQ